MRIRNVETGEIGTLIHEHEVYPYRGSVAVLVADGAQLWDEWEWLEEEEVKLYGERDSRLDVSQVQRAARP